MKILLSLVALLLGCGVAALEPITHTGDTIETTLREFTIDPRRLGSRAVRVEGEFSVTGRKDEKVVRIRVDERTAASASWGAHERETVRIEVTLRPSADRREVRIYRDKQLVSLYAAPIELDERSPIRIELTAQLGPRNGVDVVALVSSRAVYVP